MNPALGAAHTSKPSPTSLLTVAGNSGNPTDPAGAELLALRAATVSSCAPEAGAPDGTAAVSRAGFGWTISGAGRPALARIRKNDGGAASKVAVSSMPGACAVI